MKKNKFNTMLCLATSLMILYAFSTPGQSADVKKIINNVQKKYRSAKSIRIHFTEVSRFSLTGTETQVSAVLQMRGKNKFRLDSEDQVLINDGETFWRYNKLDSQVLIDYAKKNEDDVLLNNFLYDFEDHYFGQIIDEVKDEDARKYIIKMTPRPTEQSYFSSIKVWIRDKTWEIERIVYTDYSDNETEYVIEKTVFNPELSDSVFAFTAPEGIQVVDLRF